MFVVTALLHVSVCSYIVALSLSNLFSQLGQDIRSLDLDHLGQSPLDIDIEHSPT